MDQQQRVLAITQPADGRKADKDAVSWAQQWKEPTFVCLTAYESLEFIALVRPIKSFFVPGTKVGLTVL